MKIRNTLKLKKKILFVLFSRKKKAQKKFELKFEKKKKKIYNRANGKPIDSKKKKNE